MSDDWERGSSPFDLAPLLNLVSVLVPVVAMGAWLAFRASAFAPAPPAKGPPDPVEPIPSVLEVHINSQGYLVVGATGALDPKRLRPDDSFHIPCHGGRCDSADDYDAPELTKVLVEIKAASPQQQRLSLVPAPQTPYVVIVRTLAAVQEDTAHQKLFSWVEITRPY
ncbi:MAG: hypothetical protein JRI25_09160 [Deltaproteobacteria bacterium]|nr:hypothetical protein [Deltaproteobacteria bacterium]MBW2254749.1 hypothetical protein [Deltaproteobacteria bacterium]